MKELLGWFNPTRWLLVAGLAAALVLGYFAWADHIGDVREARIIEQYASQARHVDHVRAEIAPPIVKKEAAAQARIQVITETILKEVPIYVEVNACPLPGGFRVLHDAAANGEVPDPASIPDAASVPAQVATSTVAENYGTCHETAARLTGLQEWVRAQEKLNDRTE